MRLSEKFYHWKYLPLDFFWEYYHGEAGAGAGGWSARVAVLGLIIYY